VEKRFVERLGRNLNVSERAAVRAIEKLFTGYRDSKFVSENLLAPITGRKNSWKWNSIELWSEPPGDEWETWLYIAHYLRKHELSIPPGLREATDWGEVDRFVEAWRRRQQIEQWDTFLSQRAASETQVAEAKPALRLRLVEEEVQLEWRKTPEDAFSPVKTAAFARFAADYLAGRMPCDADSLPVWNAIYTGYGALPVRKYIEADCLRMLNVMLRRSDHARFVASPSGRPFGQAEHALSWRVEEPSESERDYRFTLVLPDGSSAPKALVVIDGEPPLYVTHDTIFFAPPIGGLNVSRALRIPAEALETSAGVAFFDRLRLELPACLSARVRTENARLVFHCELWRDAWGTGEKLCVKVQAKNEDGTVTDLYGREGWAAQSQRKPPEDAIVRRDRQALASAPALVEALKLSWSAYDLQWQRTVGKQFAVQFSEWLAALPRGVETVLVAELASFKTGAIRAHVSLEVEEAGIDWFDLRIALKVDDTTLTKNELNALLEARGGFVRLGDKGWRRLAFEFSGEDEKQLADLGLDTRDFSEKPQRLHALQLAGKAAAQRFLAGEQAAAVQRRADEIRMRVAPEIPSAIQASLRPYQIEGFHFLAYLSANRFGGILADDMGLGKTLQTLTWLAWVRDQPEASKQPSLVVCPKSVVENWRSEAARFLPGLRVHLLARGALKPEAVEKARAGSDLIVTNYTQLRLLEKSLCTAPWNAVILDEAQAIKNPDSQTTKAAWALKCAHRLALTGTPIENRLLDLWSIMNFVMPGALGQRAQFSRAFDQRGDPLARRRVSARVRPFVLRRTKNEVAKDLPPRIEEDLVCELEGEQGTLYRAELKRARQALLKIQTQKQFDKSRFNVLTSLLRLRQICCHPGLISEKADKAESAKLNALLELLEPLIEEGNKVLVFSQFVEMLERIRTEVAAREWPHFLLTGQTEERGDLVTQFQNTEGPAVFLISLRAGGFGLNLTAASYVVLYDPWWNPAVENQAIDRTHRIGQVNQVIAYRLLVKESIEEKIRSLQKQKSGLAADILGEESFARALSLDDFRYLLGEE
jgi:superfamily II DNA or RNA helicase